ncbi:MAG: ArsA family ATPase [Actinomycetota bacterium]|nr:ArsA family ATPase [Actinomycetota bacterium]
MRILLFTGKGGVGKTTAAAATALRLAERGRKTLVMSADPAHSLADAFGGPAIGDRPSEVAPGLLAAQVDGLARMQRHWAGGGDWPALTARLSAALSAGGLDPIVAEELAVLPGLDELMILLAVGEEVGAGLYDAVVVDCAPTGQTLRLLALPQVLDRYLERLYPTHQRMLRSLGLLARARPMGSATGAGDREILALAVHRLHESLTALGRVLTDPAITRVRLVVTPESLAMAEARRASTALALFGYAVDGVILNRVIDASDLDVPGLPAWLTTWVGAQRRIIDDVNASFPDLPIQLVGHQGNEPVGAARLGKVAQALYGSGAEGIDPLAGPERPALMQVVPDGAEYLLALAMPHVQSSELTLSRVGDDLAVSVGGHRRLVALPGLLSRCRIVGAVLDGDVLNVRFEPDPDRWPADLLRAKPAAQGPDT